MCLRFVAVVLGLSIVAATARAQSRPRTTRDPSAPPEDCRFFLPQFPPVGPPPPIDKPDGDFPDEPFFGSVVLVAPPPGVGPVPRNVELVLAGALAEIEQGFWNIELTGPDGPVPLVVDGTHIVPVGGLLPPGVVTLVLAPSPTHPCQGCFPAGRQAFDVTAVVDVTPPRFSELVLHDFVPPSLEHQTRCNQFIGTGDIVLASVSVDEVAFIDLAGRHPLVAPRFLSRGSLTVPGLPTGLFGSVASTPLVAPGDDLVVIALARDLAGNVAAPVVSRLRARSMLTVDDPTTTLDQVTETRCALGALPDVHVPERLPRNPTLRVVFPFEEQPLALRRGEQVVPLVPGTELVEDARGGRLFAPAVPLEAGPWNLVSLPCERCVCPECTAPLDRPVTLNDSVDTIAPVAPAVRELIDDAAPARAEGRCVPDRAATLVVLSPGSDDVAGPFDLVYDVVIQRDDEPPRALASALPALRRADGNAVIRVPTAPLGRVVGDPLTLELIARDTAGNVVRATHTVSVDESAGGCAAGGSGSPLVVLGSALLSGVLFRRRRSR
jgi:hypothetical protein